MSTYALLGATGQVGNTILNVLSEDSSRKIHAFVRSSQKLQRVSPDICSSPNVTIFEGDISNIDVLQKCIAGTQAVFLAVAASENLRGTRTSQNQAEAVVAALEEIRDQDPAARIPKLVMLTSSETEDKLVQNIPWPIRKMLFLANYHVYTDLMEAEKYLRSQDEWVTSVFMKPGGLVQDIARGHILSTEKQQTWLSFLDLAAGIVEVAEEDGGRWDGKSVSVLSHGKARFNWGALLLLGKGWLLYFFPWLYYSSLP